MSSPITMQRFKWLPAFEQRHEFMKGVIHIGAVVGGGARRTPPEAQQAHGVVDAQGAAVGHVGSQQGNKVAKRDRRRLAGSMGGRPQFWPCSAKGVGRCTHGGLAAEEIQMAAHLAAGTIGAHRQIAHQAQAHT